MMDVRMRGFKKRTGFSDTLKAIKSIVKETGPERIHIEKSAKRILYEDIISERDIPPFDRSAMDGYAVIAEETFKASQYSPVSLKLTENPSIKKGEASKVMTGAKIPGGATSVVMAEYAEEKDGNVLIYRPVSAGKNVTKKGEDIKKGSRVFEKGRAISPYDIGILASLNIEKIKVYKKPQISIIATGSELVEPGKKPRDGMIIDSDSHILQALAEQSSAAVSEKKIIPDDYKKIKKAVLESRADIIIITGGTSCGEKDYAPLIISEIGALLIHGISMKPSGPTGLGIVREKPVFLLPGNPVAVCVAYDFFVRYAISLMQGKKARKEETLSGRLTKKIPSAIGRTDIYRVKYEKGTVTPLRSGGASILSTMARANGYLIVPEKKEGFDEGDEVQVRLFR